MDEAELTKQPSDVTECPYKKGSFNHPDKVSVCYKWSQWDTQYMSVVYVLQDDL